MTEFLVGHGSIRNYKRLSYTPWHALAEFIDNSTQAYLDNEELLESVFEPEGTHLTVDISYDSEKKEMRISDNSFGMNEKVLERAMNVGEPPPNPTGRSRYGMGLKTAACWLGDKWVIRTTQLGDSTEHTITVDVEAVASGNTELPTKSKAVSADSHYTIIDISKMHVTFLGRRAGKTKDFLASMYRNDLRDRSLELIWQGETLRWDTQRKQFLTDNKNRTYRKDVNVNVLLDNGDFGEVSGWVGLLAGGSRAEAGFSIFHSGRMIRGYPDSWRPQEIFGQEQGSNNLTNQRVVGEFDLDQFPVTHTKDDILWSDEEAERAERAIRKEIADYLILAEKIRFRQKTGPQAGSIKKVSKSLKKDFDEKPIGTEVIPDVKEVQQRGKELKDTASRFEAFEADIDTELVGKRLRAYLSDEESSEALFASITSSAEEGFVVIANMKHPFLEGIVLSEALELYLRMLLVDIAAYDEVTKWKNSARWIAVRDSLMRALA